MYGDRGSVTELRIEGRKDGWINGQTDGRMDGLEFRIRK